MFVRTLTLGAIAALVAVPVAAQQRGTLELGAYISQTYFEDRLGLDDAIGGGGRIGLFLTPRASIEFEGGVTPAGRPGGLSNVNVAVFSGRLTVVPIKVGRLSLLLGAGLEHTDTYDTESYGLHGLIGGKIAISDNAALRADYIWSDLEAGLGTNSSIHLGLSLYRHPSSTEKVVYRTSPAAPATVRADSVSAAETARLRAAAAQLQALRDSLARTPRTTPMTPAPATGPSAATTATMQEMIHFQREQSTLSDTARRILDNKVALFSADPSLRIVIVGFASEPGTDAYNMALGLRRAEAAKAYLVSKGVMPSRIEIETRGEGQLLVEGPTDAANASNRRGQFRILLTETPAVRRP